MARSSYQPMSSWRLNLVKVAFITVVIILIAYLVDMQLHEADFLQKQAKSRHQRNIDIVAHRGMILDRHGEPLAISSPVHSVWVNPQHFEPSREQLKKLGQVLNITAGQLQGKLKNTATKHFVYIQRGVSPDIASAVKALKIPGLALQREYKRYYPAGEVTAHILGFTNIDDKGQEGVELSHNAQLEGTNGKKRMYRNGIGQFVEGGTLLKKEKDGENIQLSIDLRLQYLTYQALKQAVNHHKAASGSAVIVDVNTGEVLAMANQPTFNPNNRRALHAADYRNRAVTDLFEPGSTIKPFIIASALKSKKFTTASIIDTSPGIFKVGTHTIKDFRDYGQIDLTTLIQKSSNIGATKVALAMEPDQLWQDIQRFGFGLATGAYFPGEVLGYMPEPESWQVLDRATMAYGYGLASTTLQLARAYTILANGGKAYPLRFLKATQAPSGEQIYSKQVTKKVMAMMEAVTQAGGTSTRAAVDNYRVAGKSGTAKKMAANGRDYAENNYQSVFAGMIPASDPKLAMVIMIDDPQGEEYYGGLVAAPVFSKVMTSAMRILNITPDNVEPMRNGASR